MQGVEKVTVVSSEQLQGVFRQAQTQRKSVYLYRKPDKGSISLDLSGWNEIEVFDADNLMAIVPPGTMLKDLNAAAAARGLRFIPADNPYLENLTVGEWAYRGCPNLMSWKYGAGKHFLLGSSYVFPNGESTAVGGKCIKNVSGYDFTRFLTGAYADFAVGIQYIIKLMPQPVCRRLYNLSVSSMAAAVKLVGALQACPVPPAWLYWLDKTVAQRLVGGEQSEHRVLFEIDGNEAEVHAYEAVVKDIIDSCDAKEQSAAMLPDMSALETSAKEFWLLDEFKIPYSSVDKFSAKISDLMIKTGCKGGLFGQLADGKVHLYLEQADLRTKNFIAVAHEEARALGGTVAGKYERLYCGGCQGALAMLEDAFKQRIDPARIFNRPAEVIK